MRISKYKTEIFIGKARLIHGDTYDYSQVKYKSGNKKVPIICSRHGVFYQNPNFHLSGAHCPYCAKKRHTREEFLQKCLEIHGDKYDYSKCSYSHETKKLDLVTISCKIHGDFYQRVDLHLRGHGCPECGNEKRQETLAKKRKEAALKKPREKFIFEGRYMFKDTKKIVNLMSEPFENQSEAESCCDEFKMLIELSDSEMKNFKIRKFDSDQGRRKFDP